MNELTNEEIEEIQKYLARAYNQLCRISKLLKEGSEGNGSRQTKKI